MEEEVKVKRPHLILFLNILSTMIVGFAVDIFVPSLPALTTYFQSAPSVTRLAVTVYLVSYGIFQMIYGSLSDSFGRRKVIIFCLGAYAVCSYVITWSTGIYLFLFIRFLQGAFTAGIGVVNRALLSDSFSGKALKKYSSYILMAWGMGPILAPYIGGYLQHYIGWKACFYFIAIFALIVLFLFIFFLDETHTKVSPFKGHIAFQSYKTIFSNAHFIAGAVLCGFAYAFITIYNVVGPYLVQIELGYNSVVYGRIALILGVAWLIGIVIYRTMLAKAHIKNLLSEAIIICFFIAIVMLFLGIFNIFNLFTTALPPILIFIGGSIIFTHGFAKTLSLLPKIGGAASAALGSLFSIISGLSSGAASFLEASSLVPLALSYLVLIVLSYVIYRVFLHHSFMQEG